MSVVSSNRVPLESGTTRGMGSTLNKNVVPEMRKRLLRWFGQEQRELPWRATRDPYCVWVSEIMLQQTRVAAVIDYYNRFLQRFPDVHALAAATEADVLAAWSGLGYYRRARAMRTAAQKIIQEYGGRFPNTAAELKTLPGIGRYTAAAIASIAFGEAVAVVDGNVERVLSRVLGKDLRDQSEAWGEAEKLLDPRNAGDWNQAMMELGATICLPTQPKCLVCPVREFCGDPGRAAKKPQGIRHKRQLVYGLARRGRSIYLVQRPAHEALMSGMWELPLCDKNRESELLLTLKHSITNSDYTVQIVTLKASEVVGGKWVSEAKMRTLPITGLARKALRAKNLWPM